MNTGPSGVIATSQATKRTCGTTCIAFKAHRLDLLPVGDLRAGDAFAGHRVEFKDLARLVRAHTADHARIQIDRRGHAAAIDVVHHLAVADADIGVDDAFLLSPSSVATRMVLTEVGQSAAIASCWMTLSSTMPMLPP